MKQSQLKQLIREILDEIKINKPVKKLKAFYDPITQSGPDGQIFLLFTTTIPKHQRNSKLDHELYTGMVQEKSNQVTFPNSFDLRRQLEKRHISYESHGSYIAVDVYYFSIEPINQNTMSGGVEGLVNEIQVTRPLIFNRFKPVVGLTKVETDFFGADYYLEFVDLGSYYTLIPYANQPRVVLIPKQYIQLVNMVGDTDEEYIKKSMPIIKNLADAGKTITAEKIINEIKVESPNPHIVSFLKTNINDVKKYMKEWMIGDGKYFTDLQNEVISHSIDDISDIVKKDNKTATIYPDKLNILFRFAEHVDDNFVADEEFYENEVIDFFVIKNKKIAALWY